MVNKDVYIYIMYKLTAYNTTVITVTQESIYLLYTPVITHNALEYREVQEGRSPRCPKI